MAKRGAPLGNNNGAKNKIWSEAIRKAVLSRKELEPLAIALIDKAKSGDVQAMKEIGDRLEGKPAQTIQGTGTDGSIVVELVKFANPPTS